MPECPKSPVQPKNTILEQNTRITGEKLGIRPTSDCRHDQDKDGEHGSQNGIQTAKLHQNRPLYRTDGKVILRTGHGIMIYKQ